jgi:hypothetical protein
MGLDERRDKTNSLTRSTAQYESDVDSPLIAYSEGSKWSQLKQHEVASGVATVSSFPDP